MRYSLFDCDIPIPTKLKGIRQALIVPSLTLSKALLSSLRASGSKVQSAPRIGDFHDGFIVTDRTILISGFLGPQTPNYIIHLLEIKHVLFFGTYAFISTKQMDDTHTLGTLLAPNFYKSSTEISFSNPLSSISQSPHDSIYSIDQTNFSIENTSEESICVDMEAAHIAKFCKEKEIQFQSLLVCSDLKIGDNYTPPKNVFTDQLITTMSGIVDDYVAE